MTTFLIFGFILLLIVGVYIWYVQIISRYNKTQEALGSIDVYLKKRHNLVPNVIKLAERYMTHEKTLLENITNLRNKAQQSYKENSNTEVKEHLEAEAGLQSQMKQLFALAENYPDLKSSETIIEAQDTFKAVENDIASSRRFYNSAVVRFNNSVQIFPGTFIANMVNKEALPYFELSTDDVARKPINIEDYTKQ